MITSPIIVGLLKGCIRINIFILSLQVYYNPVSAVRALKQLLRVRQGRSGKSISPRFIRSGRRFHKAINIPGWPSRAFNQFVKNELSRISNQVNGRSNLQTVFLGVTDRCSLSCKHCSNAENTSNKRENSSKVLENIVKRLESAGIYHIQFTGGEPLEVFDTLIRLIRTARKMDSWILTSGFGLTPQKAIRMKEAGLAGVNISLDHWNEKEHNSFRGNNKSFYWVKKAVENCKEAGLLVSVSLCPTKEFTSQENLDRYLDLTKRWEVHFIRILEPKESGNYANRNIRLSEDQIIMLEDLFLENRRIKKDKTMPVLMYPDLLNRPRCIGKGDRYLYIDRNGYTHTCPFNFKRSGNILEDPINLIVEELGKTECINCNHTA